MIDAKQIIIFGILLFALGIGIFVITFATRTLTSSMMSIATMNSTAELRSVWTGTNNATDRYDYLIFGTFIGLILGYIIMGWFAGGEPIFAVIYFIITVIAVIVSMFLANFWNNLANASIFGTTISHFPLTNHILLYLPLYSGIVGVLAILIMFSRNFISRDL